MIRRKKYVQVGLVGRHTEYLDSILFDFSHKCEIAGVCDINEGRLKNDLDYISSKAGVKVPGYSAAEFDRMLEKAKPDTVIVTTKDSTHDGYICRAMEAGCDVITEKNMTTDEKKCQRIIDVQRRTGRNCTVAFNYMPDYPAMPGSEMALKMLPREDVTYYHIGQDVKVSNKQKGRLPAGRM